MCLCLCLCFCYSVSGCATADAAACSTSNLPLQNRVRYRAIQPGLGTSLVKKYPPLNNLRMLCRRKGREHRQPQTRPQGNVKLAWRRSLWLPLFWGRRAALEHGVVLSGNTFHWAQGSSEFLRGEWLQTFDCAIREQVLWSTTHTRIQDDQGLQEVGDAR